MIGLMRSMNRPSLGRVLVGLGVALALLMAVIWISFDTGGLPTIELETPRGRIVVELATRRRLGRRDCQIVMP